MCKLDQEPKWRRGYIAMLAVEEAYRRRGIGMELVKKSIEVMRQIGCDEVCNLYSFSVHIIFYRLC